MHAYATSAERTRTYGLIAVIAVGLAILLQALADALHLGPAWLLSPPTVASTFYLCYLAVDRCIWQWALFHRVGIIDVPVIEGHYVGTLTSVWDGKPRPIEIQIDQTWTRIAIRFRILETASSTSYSVAAALNPIGHNLGQLTYSYKSQIRPGIAEPDMADHDGAAELDIGTDGTATGRYFNFRGRQGTLELHRLP